MGSGWLIEPDLMVTAGHNVYNWAGPDGDTPLGQAVTIQCHIGYHGEDSVGNDPSVQSRMAKRCVTSAEWLQNKKNRHRDFAIIQVDRPFTGNLRLFRFENTPSQGNESIGVVGYPGDMRIRNKSGKMEAGALMYMQFAGTAYNRNTSKLGLLTYRISTFGGQSGSPVIRHGRQVGIGTHVYGYGDKNQASPIVDLANFVNAFKRKFPCVGSVEGIQLYKPVAPPVRESFNDPGTEEGFLDVLKSIGGVVSNVGRVALPAASVLLGPIGAPISAIAGTALGALGRVCAESTLDGSVSKLEGMVNNGETQRGVLAEATLQGLEKLRHVHPRHEGLKRLHDDMAETYKTFGPNLMKLAPHFESKMIWSAAQIGCNTDFIAKHHAYRGSFDGPQDIRPEGAESGYGINDAFHEALMEPTKRLPGEEAFFETVGDFFSKALAVSKPVLRASAVAGLSKIADSLAKSGASESAQDTTGPGNESMSEMSATRLLLNRAIVAECALQAVSKLNAEQLDDLKIGRPDESEAYQESFLSFIKTAAQKIGGVVQTVAPIATKYVIPVVLKAVKGAGGGQESTRDDTANGANRSPWDRNQEESLDGGNKNTQCGCTGPQNPARSVTRQSSRFQLTGGNGLGAPGLAVGALLPQDESLTQQQVIASLSRPLQGNDSNLDLPLLG